MCQGCKARSETARHRYSGGDKQASDMQQGLCCCVALVFWHLVTLAHMRLWPAGQPSLLKAVPAVAAEWHPTKNYRLKLQNVTCGSGLEVWWLCKKGQCEQCGHAHEWQAKVSKRAQNGTGCPICDGTRACPCRSLAALHQDLIQQQWDFDCNELKPETLLPQSGRTAHWRCLLHQPPWLWEARINSRVAGAKGCSECARLHHSSRPGP